MLTGYAECGGRDEGVWRERWGRVEGGMRACGGRDEGVWREG